jgi:hypothetical protein
MKPDSGAIKARIIAGQLVSEPSQVHEVRHEAFFQLGILCAKRPAVDQEHLLDRRALQAFEQHPFSDHPSGAGYDDLEFRQITPPFFGSLALIPLTINAH